MVDRRNFPQCAQPWIVWSTQDHSPFPIDYPRAKAHSPALRSSAGAQSMAMAIELWYVTCPLED